MLSELYYEQWFAIKNLTFINVGDIKAWYNIDLIVMQYFYRAAVWRGGNCHCNL